MAYRLTYAPCFKGRTFDFDEVWQWPEEELITRSTTSDVCVIRWNESGANGESTAFYRKRYWYPGWKSKFRGFFRNTFFRASRARAEYRNLSWLNGIGLSRLLPVCCGEDRRFRFLERAFIVTQSIPDTCTLSDYVNSKDFTGLSLEGRRIALAALARWCARLHNRGYKDRDFFARNILVHTTEMGLCFSKIDSPKATWGADLPGLSSPYIQDLKDLDGDLRNGLSRADRLRAFLAYLGAGRVDGSVRKWIERILL